MKATIKLLFFILAPIVLGYFVAITFGKIPSSILLFLASLGAVFTLPAIMEMIIKALFQKNKNTDGVKLSKVSGYLFLLGLVLFFIGVGYSFNI